MSRLAPDDLADPRRGADRNRALVDDDLVAVHRAGNVARDGEHVLKVCRAVLAGGRSDGDENDLRVAHAPGERRRERQAFFGPVLPDDFLETGLIDRNLALLEHPDLRGILVHADDVVAVLGQTRTCDEPHVTASNDRNLHQSPAPARANPAGYKTLSLARRKNAVNLLTGKGLPSRSGNVSIGGACTPSSTIGPLCGSEQASASMPMSWHGRSSGSCSQRTR